VIAGHRQIIDIVVFTFCVSASQPDAIVSTDDMNDKGTHSNQTQKVWYK
jgi:hypothetical protein